MNKAKTKEEERKMRISNEEKLRNHKLTNVKLEKAMQDEEKKAKDLLDEKQKIEQENVDLDEKLRERMDLSAFNRDEIIKSRVKNSQLEKQKLMLDEEEKQLEKSLAELTTTNDELEKDNEDHKKKIAMCIQRIEINNLLKSIDKEEL